MTGRLEELRKRLMPAFLEGIAAKQAVLTRALMDHRLGEPHGEPTARRLAHQIRGTAASYGLPALSVAAAAVETATKDHFETALVALLQMLAVAKSGSAKPMRVLLVDDEPNFRTLVTGALAGPNLAILPAASCAEAQAFLDSLSFDCVILDLALPDGDGRTLLGELLERTPAAHTPVIVLTASTDPAAEAECRALGAAQVVRKPVDLELLNVMVSATVSRTTRLIQEARTDALTGLPNRQAFEVAFTQHQATNKRRSEPSCLALIDLDHFKFINDTFGHPAGDCVLRKVGEVLTATLREGDIVARWGGEEFAVLLPLAEPTDAAAVLDRARQALKKTLIEEIGEDRNITFSAGVASIEADTSLEDGMLRADRRLYLAKRAGRDRVLKTTSEGTTRPHILLVDDDEHFASWIRVTLGDEFDVTWLNDGRKALEAARQDTHHSLVLLDVQMPGLDGHQTLRALRLLPRYRNVPVMMVTSSNAERDIEDAFAHGADDYIEKPVNARELRARVRRMLERSGALRVSRVLRRTLR